MKPFPGHAQAETGELFLSNALIWVSVLNIEDCTAGAKFYDTGDYDISMT